MLVLSGPQIGEKKIKCKKSWAMTDDNASANNDDDAVLPDFHDRWENILSQVIVTEQEVIDMLCTLNANKAVGPDII